MPRRSPARVRTDLPRRLPPGQRIRTPPGLSARGVAAVARLERTRLWPGATAEALSALARFVNDPIHRLWDQQYGCGIMECCPDPPEVRRILALVAPALPPRDARRFRRQVAALDELW